MDALLLHILLLPLIIVPVVWMLRKRLFRDAVLFAAVSVMGYLLWLRIVNHRPFIISLFIEKLLTWNWQ